LPFFFSIEIVTEPKIADIFAKVADEGRACAFLEENQLCAIHKNYGPDYLPYVCALFPRRIFVTPRGFEVSVIFSCPETMKLLLSEKKIEILTNPQGFSFSVSDITLPAITRRMIDSSDDTKWYFRLEETFIEILQDRVLTLEVRMAVIGILIYYFRSYLYDKQRQRDFPELLKNYRVLAKEARALETNKAYQLQVLKNFLDFRKALRVSEDFYNIAQEVYQALGLRSESPLTADNIKLYELKTGELYNEREIGFIAANYLVYNMFSKLLFIFGIEGGFFALSFIYALIRLLAVGVAAFEGKPVDQHILLKVIAAVDFNIRHASEFMDHILLSQGIKKYEPENVSVAKSLALLR
ncbi:MAG: flagellin lysine-N-methylase, partial [Firmicutes bacterium]|nr:flagellin lysine-N-methylase [Bacillota bacterium]